MSEDRTEGTEMALRLSDSQRRSMEESLRRALVTDPAPPHYCGRCGVLLPDRGTYILHECGGPPAACLERIGREPLDVFGPGGKSIVGPDDFRLI